MKNIAIILAVAILSTYAFIAVNERQKERVIRLRLPKFRKINKYEFDKALYQIRETRAKRLKGTTQSINHQGDTSTEAKEEFYNDYEYLENLKNSPSTEAQPIQDPSAEFQGQQDELTPEQQEAQAQTMTQELAPGQPLPQQQQQQLKLQEDMPQTEQPQIYQVKPRLRTMKRYQPQQAETNDGN